MDEYAGTLIEKYKNRGILLDANLCLLFLIGQIDPSRIGHERGVKEFAGEDYRLLREILECFRILYTTPNVVTEVSNLLRAGGRERMRGATEALRRWVILTKEEYVEGRNIVGDPCFMKFGITDAGLKIVLSRGILLVTTDWPLAGYVEALKFDVLNFNNLRYQDIQGK